MGVPRRSVRPPRRAGSTTRSVRAARSPEVWRATTTHSTARIASSQNINRCRPLSATALALRPFEDAQGGGAGARVAADLGGGGAHASLLQDPSQRPTAAGAHRLTGGTDAGAAPLAESVLDDAVLPRVIRDHAQPAARDEGVAERGQRGLELLELAVHSDAQRLEQAREVGRPRAFS